MWSLLRKQLLGMYLSGKALAQHSEGPQNCREWNSSSHRTTKFVLGEKFFPKEVECWAEKQMGWAMQ
jgi:hypothetical protein